MVPVLQRTDNDCFRCCVASVLELDYNEVPGWHEDLPNGSIIPDDVHKAIREWFALRQMVLIDFPMEAPSMKHLLDAMNSRNKGFHYLVIGQNRTGRDHAVVCKDGEMAWNPKGNTSILPFPSSSGYYHVLIIGELL